MFSKQDMLIASCIYKDKYGIVVLLRSFCSETLVFLLLCSITTSVSKGFMFFIFKGFQRSQSLSVPSFPEVTKSVLILPKRWTFISKTAFLMYPVQKKEFDKNVCY